MSSVLDSLSDNLWRLPYLGFAILMIVFGTTQSHTQAFDTSALNPHLMSQPTMNPPMMDQPPPVAPPWPFQPPQ
jgi:hypothetical protein